MDTNRHNLREAQELGLDVQYADSVTEHALEETDLAGIGHVMAVTPNDEINQLTALNFREAFDRSNVYQLAPAGGHEELSTELSGRTLFAPDLTVGDLVVRFREGWTIDTQPVPPDLSEEALDEIVNVPGKPLVVVESDGDTVPIAEGQPFDPGPGDWVIRMVPPDDEAPEEHTADE